MLVGIHSALMLIWAMGTEHRLLISQERQGIVSLLVTGTTTTFGTVCISVQSKTHIIINEADLRGAVGIHYTDPFHET